MSDASAVLVANYTYDAWGNVTSVTNQNGGNITTLTNRAHVNPIRYRGYYFDTETGMYYLQSRYYNPQWGRFLNQDGTTNTETGLLGTNMFAYCNNNPVVMVDVDGEKPQYWVDFQVGFSYNSPSSINCYGYALGLSYGVEPGFKSGAQNNYNYYYSNRGRFINVDTISNRVAADLRAMKRSVLNVTGLGGPNFRCSKNQYLIAIRVTASNTAVGRNWDYHFMRKGTDGTWRFKGGWANGVFELRPGLNPNNVGWNTYKRGVYVSSRTSWKKKYTSYSVKSYNVYVGKIIYMVIGW